MKQMFICGRWVAAQDERTLPVISPEDGESFDSIARGGAHEVDLAVQAARKRARRRLGPHVGNRARPRADESRPGGAR